jgi:hypothetical protein
MAVLALVSLAWQALEVLHAEAGLILVSGVDRHVGASKAPQEATTTGGGRSSRSRAAGSSGRSERRKRAQSPLADLVVELDGAAEILKHSVKMHTGGHRVDMDQSRVKEDRTGHGSQLREVAVDPCLDGFGQVGGELDMVKAHLPGGLLESRSDCSQGLGEEEARELGRGGSGSRIEEGQGEGKGLDTPGEVQQARKREGLGLVLAGALGLDNGHAEVLAVPQRQLHLGGLGNRRVQPLGTRHQEEVGHLKTAASTPVLGLGKELDDGLVYTKADIVITDPVVEGNDARASIGVARDRRQLAGSAVQAAVESLHKGERLGGGGGGRGRGGSGRMSRRGELLVSQVLIHAGHILTHACHLLPQELQGRTRPLGFLGVQAPGGGVEVHGMEGLRREAGAEDRVVV